MSKVIISNPIGLLLKSKVQFMQAEGARPFDGLTCSLSRISVLSIKFVFVESSFERKRRFALLINNKHQKANHSRMRIAENRKCSRLLWSVSFRPSRSHDSGSCGCFLMS
jgi:hypothetical protein